MVGAWIAWIAVAVVSVGRALLFYHSPKHTGIYHVFADAGRDWVASRTLYTPGSGLEVFRYHPLLAVLFVPLSALPDAIGSALLRLANVGVLALGLLESARVFMPSADARRRAALFLLAWPLAFQALGDVQTTGITAGLCVLCAAWFVRGLKQRTWRPMLWAGLAAAGAVAIKAYPLALGMLLVLLAPRRFGPWFVVGLIAVCAVPFVAQRPSYVSEQYRTWVEFGLNARDNGTSGLAFRDVRTLLHVGGVTLSTKTYQIVEVVAGGMAAALVLALRVRGVGLAPLTLVAFCLATLWMTVFGPATESQTYILAAPASAYIVLLCAGESARSPRGVLAIAGLVLIAITQFALWFPPGRAVHAWGLHAAGGLLLIAAISWHAWTLARSAEVAR